MRPRPGGGPAEVVPTFVELLAALLQPLGAEAVRGTAAEGRGRASSHRMREAYIATLRRNPATLELFLRSAADRSLLLEAVDWRDSGVRFHHVGALDDPRVAERILLHRVRGVAPVPRQGQGEGQGKGGLSAAALL